MNLDLDREYSPTLHTKRFQNFAKPDEEVINNFINVSEKATLLARQQYKTRLDVRYGGDNDNQLLDIYFKGQEEGTPIFVYIHGGYWQLLDKSTSGPLVFPMIEHNYRIILVDYNLCPQVTLEQITQQICNFYKWLQKYAVETKAPKICISGHSAGAHLSLQMFREEFLQPLKRLNLIEQIFLISGVYDLRELWCLKSVNPNDILNVNADKAKELSPFCWLFNMDLLAEYQKQGLRIHILVGENDSDRFKQQAQEYYNKLRALKLHTEYKEFKAYDHFDIIEECVNPKSSISSYIRESLQGI
ncbi:kynurenine formamidase-like [Lucilia sericata]|uniref:kynurenine formamidase-like n=1 Tax=Lucilia sericata TaxID=13632 RepID=UPI0018A8784A|nr:kynurenine formamidase-like [Lucilia sericata]